MMTTEYKVLGQALAIVGVRVPLYTVPMARQTVVSTITLCNQSNAAVTVRLSVHPSGHSTNAKHHLLEGHSLAAKDTLMLTIGITLGELHTISILADSASVSATVFGAEETVESTLFVPPTEWPTLTPIPAGTQKLQGIYAVYEHDSNFIAFTCAENYTVDWGDGSSENVATGVQANHQYTYSSLSSVVVGSAETVAVTFTDTGDTVDWVAHGLYDGCKVSFASITSTTGISTNTTYYVVNKTADTFKLAATMGGSALALTTNGSGTLYFPKYKTAVVTITPNGGNLTSIDLQKKHSQSSLNAYCAPWLVVEVNGEFLTTLVISQQNATVPLYALESAYIGENALASMAQMFNSCFSLTSVYMPYAMVASSFSKTFMGCISLQSIPMIDTSNADTLEYMFSNCSALTHIPLLDTASCLNMRYMFNQCSALESVPLLDTGNVTNFDNAFGGCKALVTFPPINTYSATVMTGMFASCYALKNVPLLDTHAVTYFDFMFVYCYVLEDIPEFNTASGIAFSYMFSSCYSLITIPLLKTDSGTAFDGMFNGCTALQYVPPLNINGCSYLGSMFSGCSSLSRNTVKGAKATLSIENNRMSAAALDEFYTNLASGVTAKTVTVTGNYGTTGDTPSIATSKGWTVTG